MTHPDFRVIVCLECGCESSVSRESYLRYYYGVDMYLMTITSPTGCCLACGHNVWRVQRDITEKLHDRVP